jgi:hypothetical protein
MYAKSGLSLVAAAGVAFGVVGMTMGGAASAPPECAPAQSASVSGSGSGDGASFNADTTSSGANGNGSDANGNNGNNPAGTGALGPVGLLDPAGTGSGVPVGTGPAGPAGTSTTLPGGSDGGTGNGGSLIDIEAGTNTGSAAAPAPTTPTTSGSNRPWIDLRGNTDGEDAADPVIVPPSASQVVANSTRLSRLFTLDGAANLGR